MRTYLQYGWDRWPKPRTTKERKMQTENIPNPRNATFTLRRRRVLAMGSSAAIVVIGLGAFALLPPVREIQTASRAPVQIAANDSGRATPRMLRDHEHGRR
jgi:hypothetical protein